MASRALLIASQTFGLTGCNADVALMQRLLGDRGFDRIATLIGENASRQGIVDAFETLIVDAASDDAVVVYYSGHGGRAPHPDWEARQARGLPAHLQFIVPWDIEASAEDDFLGLLAEELSDLQWRLTDRTTNVTLILDCCHSGYMARSADLVPKAISRSFPAAGVRARLASLPPARRDTARDTNPYAVRIVACQPEQSAYERASDLEPGTHGVLTESLAVVLDDIGKRRLSWAAIGRLVRDRVVSLAPQQQPAVEGPAARLPFSLSLRAHPQAYPVRIDGATAAIEAASLLGVRQGDTFHLVEDDETAVGTAEVSRVEGNRATLEVRFAPGVQSLPPACDAVPLTTSTPLRPVRVAADGGRATALQEAVERSPRLRVAADREPVLATIRDDAGGWAVEDGAGLRMRTERLSDDETGRGRVVEGVELLAAAERMRKLRSGDGPAAFDVPLDVELVRHDAGGKTRCDRNGERLFIRDRISLTIRNRGDSVVFAWLFDVGVSNRTTLVTNDAPSGARLEPAGTAGDTRTIGGQDGTALEWPADVPDDAGRAELFLILLANKPQDLRPLETAIGTARRAAGDPLSPLDALLEEARSGTREFPVQVAAAPVRYRVEQVDFFLEPRTRPRLAEPPFELDDRPDPSVRSLAPRAAEPPPRKVAVRLVEMMVRKNRALFRAAVRVDALVVTRGPEGGPGIAYPTTYHFQNIGDDTILPLDNVRLYDGEVHDFLDLAIWVNRDDSKGKDLAELFAAELETTEVKGALTALGGLVFAAPQVAVAFGAVAAVAVLVSTGARLVEIATGREIGTYRTSKLAFERFGVGRSPAVGRRQAQDLEFAYEVIEVE